MRCLKVIKGSQPCSGKQAYTSELGGIDAFPPINWPIWAVAEADASAESTSEVVVEAVADLHFLEPAIARVHKSWGHNPVLPA